MSQANDTVVREDSDYKSASVERLRQYYRRFEPSYEFSRLLARRTAADNSTVFTMRLTQAPSQLMENLSNAAVNAWEIDITDPGEQKDSVVRMPIVAHKRVRIGKIRPLFPANTD